MSFGAIGKSVYGAPEGRSGLSIKKRQSVYDQAERAYKKVKKLIEHAENAIGLLPAFHPRVFRTLSPHFPVNFLGTGIQVALCP